jgi:hypothetical protein
VAVLALVAALAVVAGSLRPGVPSERSEALFITPGGIAALPSFMPALVIPLDPASGVDQILPAVAPASGPGSFAIVTAMCPTADCPDSSLGASLQPDSTGQLPSPTVKFTMSKEYPPGGIVAATFTASGQQTLVCKDDAACDLSARESEGFGVQHVAVGLTGGGENEVVRVTACYEPGSTLYPGPVPGARDCRSVLVAFVETILIVPPMEAASAAGPAIVSYRCDEVGLYTRLSPDTANGLGIPFATRQVSWEEVFDWFFAPRGQMFLSGSLRRPTSLLPMDDIPFYSCGADTAATADDRVTFETDIGMFSVDWTGDIGSLMTRVDVPPPAPPGTLLGYFRPWGTLSPACDAGDSVDILDGPGPVASNLSLRGGVGQTPATISDVPADWCDINFAPNGVVTYLAVGTGEPGAATVTAQQSGGVGPLRSSNISFAGGSALALVMDAPEVIGMDGGKFSVVVVDPGFRFLEGVTVECSAEPKEAVLAITPQTGTSGALPEPFVFFTLYPTRSAVETGVDVTITCFVDDNPEVKAVAVARIGKPVETVDLVAGCNPVTSTWPDDTDIETVAAAVSPPEALDAIWALDPETGVWQGYSPATPEASDLASVNELDVIFVCMNAPGTISRLVI